MRLLLFNWVECKIRDELISKIDYGEWNIILYIFFLFIYFSLSANRKANLITLPEFFLLINFI